MKKEYAAVPPSMAGMETFGFSWMDFVTAIPAPLFLVEDALLEGVYPLSEGKHVRLRLRQGSAVLNAVYFGKGPDTLCYAPGAQVDVVLALSIFEGKAGPTVSARVKDMRPAGLKDDYLDTLLPAQAALARTARCWALCSLCAGPCCATSFGPTRKPRLLILNSRA